MQANDPQYSKPFIDVDEWRDAPVRHRYVHGGFEGTDLLFSYYFPPEETYGGRHTARPAPKSADAPLPDNDPSGSGSTAGSEAVTTAGSNGQARANGPFSANPRFLVPGARSGMLHGP